MNPITIAPTMQGKVRDIYDLGETMLVVATDRISAFDYILDSEIPGKGAVLTQLSVFWFELLEDVVENHLVSADVADLPEQFSPWADYLDGRFMLVRKAQMLPVECIVRGYLTGSGLKSYRQDGTVCGIGLPAGLTEASKLPEVLFTPSTKAAIGEHDENISFEECSRLVGAEAAEQLRELTLSVYNRAAEHAAERGILIADTKLEFGQIDGRMILADEVLTPDSSRFWAAATYREGEVQPSFDKQYVRNWLNANWDRSGKPPVLPAEVVQATSEKYREAYEMITGRKFAW